MGHGNHLSYHTHLTSKAFKLGSILDILYHPLHNLFWSKCASSHWWYTIPEDTAQPCVCCYVWFFVAPWTVACQATLWNSPGKNTGVGCHSLLQGTFPTQESNLGLLHCRQVLYHWATSGAYNFLIKHVFPYHNNYRGVNLKTYWIRKLYEWKDTFW